MNLPAAVRVSVTRIALLGAATLSLGLFSPVHASAAPNAAHAEQRAARAEERASRRALRHQEAEARHQLRAEERASRRDALRNGITPNDEAPEGSEGGPPPSEATPSARSYRGCSVTLAVSSPQVTAGETVELTGTLTCPSSAEASTPTVAVYQRENGAANRSLAVPGNVATLPDGSFTMTSKPLESNTVFQVQAGNHRARAAVKVAPAITLALSSPSALASSTGSHHARTVAVFTGTVTPAAPGALVALQVAYGATGEDWHSVAWAHVTAEGTYSIPHAFRIPGETSVRTILHSGRGHAVAASEPLSYPVVGPQNAQLTILSSADPLPADSPVTISGVAAGAAGQTVKLLARTPGGTFAPADETTTDPSGNYTFTETPTESTFYRVTDAATQSSILFQGVGFALVTDPAPTGLQAGTPALFTGSVGGAPAGATVYLEQRNPSGIHFHVIATGTVDASSHYSISHSFTRAGSVLARIRVPGAGTHATTAGAPFALEVTS
jgi:hypothetical protein